MTAGNDFYGLSQEARRAYFKTKRLQVPNLTGDEREELMQEYGMQLEDAIELQPAQACFFSGEEFVSPDFYIQSLYKINSVVDEHRFSLAVERLIALTPVLRTNFYRTRQGRALQIVQREGKLTVNYTAIGKRGQELDTILDSMMEADRRKPFNLAHGMLLRISMFRTGVREYALLLTQPQIIADGWDVRMLFERYFTTEELQSVRLPAKREITYASYLQQRNAQDKATAYHYWQYLLRDLPPMPQLPGYTPSAAAYKQAVSQMSIGSREVEKILELAQGDMRLAASVLHTAWGVVLQQAEQQTDTYFCLRLSSRDARLSNVTATGTLFNAMPVRVKAIDTWSIREFINVQFRQVIISQPLSYCSKKEFKELAKRNGEVFNHFLCFHGFLAGKQRYSEVRVPPGAVPVTLNSFDDQRMDLGIYFRYDGHNLFAEFVYNENCFSKAAVELMMQRFSYVLRLILANQNKTVGQLKRLLTEKVSWEPEKKQLLSREEMTDCLNKIDFLRVLPAEVIDDLLLQAKAQAFQPGDFVLRGDVVQDRLCFLAKGEVKRRVATLAGWYYDLDIIHPAELLNEEALLLNVPSSLAVEALNQVIVLQIPAAAVQHVLTTYPEAAQRLIQRLLKRITAYQKRIVGQQIR